MVTDMEGPAPRGFWLAVLGLVAAGVLVLANLAGSTFVCGFDTSYCAESTDKDGAYTGAFLLDGEPYVDGPFLVTFESRDDRDPVEFHTDQYGNYCVQWSRESIVPFAQTPDGQRLQNVPGETGESEDGLREFTESAPADCEQSSEGIPWDRARDLDSSWQFRVLLALPILSAGVLLWALVARRTSQAWVLQRTGLGLLAGGVLAFAVLWFL